MTNQICDISALLKWFEKHKRSFPWRHRPTAYSVWVSEMMLQQTRANVVLPYFEKWMQHFPTVQELASAPLDVVIKLWEGLGYYARARYLHQGAKQIVEQFDGIFPEQESLLRQIKGLGPYTIGAIRSFAFHQKAPAVDGNVLRVLSRYFGLEEDIASASTRKKMEQYALHFLSNQQPWIAAEALIELGALICTKNPQCMLCPLQKNCRAHLESKTHLLPYKTKKKSIEPLHRAVAVIAADQQVLLQRVPAGKIMSDLHELPYWEIDPLAFRLQDFCKQACVDLNISLQEPYPLPVVKHQFTRFRVTLYPYLFDVNKPKAAESLYQWVDWKEIKHLAFSAGHRKIIQYLLATKLN